MPFVNGVWVPEDDSVATRVASLTAQDSPLMTQAATRGTQLANRRGLLNSSLAAQAAQEGVISAATPIASQDAAATAQKNSAYQTAGYDTIARGETIAADALGRRETLAAEAARTKETIAAGDRQNLLSAGVTVNGQYLDSFGQIAGNKDIPAASRDAYLNSILAARGTAETLARSIYGVTLEWTPPPTTGPAVDVSPVIDYR